jgi:hypothetical protein
MTLTLNIKKLSILMLISMLALTSYAADTNQPTRNALESLKKEVFKPVCFFITVGKDPYLKVLKPGISEIKTIKCGCEQENCTTKITSASDLENLSPLRLTILNYCANTKLDVRYRGDREAVMGKVLERIFLPAETYKGKILLDEYKENIPMFWILNTTAELKAIKNYFIKNLDAEFIPTQKIPLVIKINDDAKLEKLEPADKEFIEKYFELYTPTDPDVKNFFENGLATITDNSYCMDISDPLHVGESTMQSIFRQVEKNYKKFDAKDIAIVAGVTLFGTLVISQIGDEIKAAKDIVMKKAVGDSTFVGAINNCCKPSPATPIK